MILPPSKAAPPVATGNGPPSTSPPRPCPQRSPTYRRTLSRAATGVLLACMALTAGMSNANAADAVLAAGDAVITGFSGIRPSGAPLPPGGNPLDGFFINDDGPSAQIQSLSVMGEPPQGQLVSPGLRKQFFAREIGQVFPIALDDGNGAKVPNIYLGATSMYGLHIVKPDGDGDGEPDRTKTGAPGATWMPGMFAEDNGGSPGAIWRVDGTTGEVKLFATIPDNAGPGLGDVVFDKTTKQFFASDLDTGLIHRLDADGQLIDTFDHGVDGRPAKGLAALPDDGSKADITSAAFDIEKPDTWGYTQTERRVYGMAVRDGRLFYTVDHQVWSIGINQDGGFAGDARWEVDVETTAPDTQLSDMLFDGDGRMYVAERAAQRGSYDYSLFAEAEKAEVKRYALETPDDPATPSRWVEVPETYAIGLPPEHRHSNGGITLGFPYDETGQLKTGSCGQFLWTTGERLRAGEFAQGDGEGDPAANADVHGLQGNPIDLVRPQNVPPMTTYFTDYDQFFGDAEKAGHMGDVEIWQPCDGVPAPQETGELPPWWNPPGDGIPPEYPPEFPPPEHEFHTNLELRKWADPKTCFSWGSYWICGYKIRIRNTGPEDYFGDITIRDTFPFAPPGFGAGFQPQPPWTCWNPGGNPSETRCWQPDVFLPSGNSIFMTVWAALPKAADLCRLTNIAEIEWAPGGTQWNTNPADDIDDATAIIPDPDCRPVNDRTDLELRKKAEGCKYDQAKIVCTYHITVENKGPGTYEGPLVVRDDLPGGVDFDWSSHADWNCANAGGNTFECAYSSPVSMAPTEMKHLWVFGTVPIGEARRHDCRIPNRAWIADPVGAPKNFDDTNDAEPATAEIPSELCQTGSNLNLEKFAKGCRESNLGYECDWLVNVRNTGLNRYRGVLRLKDRFNGYFLIGSNSAEWTCSGVGLGSGVECSQESATLEPGAPPLQLAYTTVHKREDIVAANCSIQNHVEVEYPTPGSPENQAGGDTADARNAIPQLCQRPRPPSCPPGYRLDDGQCVPKRQPPGPGIIDPPPPPPPPPVDYDCPYGMHEVSSTRAHYLRRQEGWIVRRYHGLWCVKPPRETPCPSNYEEVPQSRVDILRRKGWTIRNVSRDKWCGKPPIVTPECKWPLVGKYPDCHRPHEVCPVGMDQVSRREARHRERHGAKILRLRNGRWCAGKPDKPDWKICPNGSRIPIGKDCPVIEPPCPSGMHQVPVGDYNKLSKAGWILKPISRTKLCGRPGKICPRNTHLDDGECVPDHGGRVCKPPLVGKWPNCRKPDPVKKCWNGQIVPAHKSCPPEPTCEAKGMTGKWPRCVPRHNEGAECKKKGGHWNGKVCVIRQVTCPDGSKAPSRSQCPRVRKCPNGSVVPLGKQCPIVRLPCPAGTVGKYQPNCRKIEVRKPCPPGTVGKYQPNCRKIEVKKPCPPGTVGRFQPHCKQIVKPIRPPKHEVKPIRKPCPPSTVGRFQPHCKVIKNQQIQKLFKPN